MRSEDSDSELSQSDSDCGIDWELPDVVLEVEVEEQAVEEQEDDGDVEEDEVEEQKQEEQEERERKKERQPIMFGQLSLDGLSSLPGAFRYYTSFEDKTHFNYVFDCLGPGAYHLKYHSKLQPREEFLLLMMKLRQNKDDIELSWMFGISAKVVGKVFKTWLNFVYFQLKELNIWPNREIIDTHMPSDFKKKFPKTRVVLDGSEIPIEKPSNPKEQSGTWSSYKNRNTLKILVGISPRGDVSYISDVYGGAASDRAIVERSELLKEGKFDREDSVMADRGFVVHDLFCLHQVHVNIPTVMRNMVQLPPDKVIRDRRIASKRVHVERIIGLAKTYKILKEDLHHHYTPLGGRILYVCFALVNFRPCIVDSNA